MKRIERQRMFERLQNESSISNEEYDAAYKRVKRIKGFYTHLIVYVLVNLYLIAIQCFDQHSLRALSELQTYVTSFFWGIGIVAHGISVFGRTIFFGTNWEERKIRELMNKDKNNNQFE